MLFEKKVLIFKKKDKETYQQIKKALKEDGIRGVSAWHLTVESNVTFGLGAVKSDPRDFGPNGVQDHDVYYIKVKESVKDAALEAIRKRGLVAVIDEDAALDAKDRYEKQGAFDR